MGLEDDDDAVDTRITSCCAEFVYFVVLELSVVVGVETETVSSRDSIGGFVCCRIFSRSCWINNRISASWSAS